MAAHDWRQWTPGAQPNSSRWRLIRFDRIDVDGNPVGRCIENTAPGGHVRTFASEAEAQRIADYLNTQESEGTDA